MPRLFGRVPPACGRTADGVARLSEARLGALYRTRALGRLYGDENVRAMWHFGFFNKATGKSDPHGAQFKVGGEADFDNQVNLGVRYLKAGADREAFRVTVGAGGKLERGGALLDTSSAQRMFQNREDGWFIFAMDENGRLYAADNRKEFYAGSPLSEPGGPRSTGLKDYWLDCAEDLAKRLVAGVPMRHFAPAEYAPVDHYASIWQEGPVPCAIALPGPEGAAAAESPPPPPVARWRRTPWRSGAPAEAVVVQNAAGAPALYAPYGGAANEPAVYAPYGGAAVVPAGGEAPARPPVPIVHYVPAGAEAPPARPVQSAGGSTPGARPQPVQIVQPAGGDYVPAGGEAPAGRPKPVQLVQPAGGDYVPADGRADGPAPYAYVPAADDAPAPYGYVPAADGPAPYGYVPAADDPQPLNQGVGFAGVPNQQLPPFRYPRGQGAAPRCLGTIEPGNGVYVRGAPRTPSGGLDLVELLRLFSPGASGKPVIEEEWDARQTKYAQEWEQREDHLAAKPSKPPRKGEPAPPAPPPFQRVPFVRQPFPGPLVALSEVPTGGGWVCKSCLGRRRRWPLVYPLKLAAEVVEDAMTSIRAGEVPLHFAMLPTRLKVRGVIPAFVATQLEALGEIPAPRRLEVFHHSSFLAGAPVAAAGELRVEQGVITRITNDSGHYLPPAPHLVQVLRELHRQQADLSRLQVHFEGGPKAWLPALSNGELDPTLADRAGAIQDARIAQGDDAHGSQDDKWKATREVLRSFDGAIGVRLSPTQVAPKTRAADGPIPCANPACKQTSATVDVMEHVPGLGFLCEPCHAKR